MILPTGVRVSKRGMPMFNVCNRYLAPHEVLKKMIVTWNWRLIRSNSDYYRLRIGKYIIKLTPEYFSLVFGEWVDWKRVYRPLQLEGLTILDVGAGCGETALFYFLHGAKRVICVEPNPSLARVIQENIRTNNWDAEVWARPFELEMLDTKVDFMKMDCEGCEVQLLNANTLPPCTIEIHDKEVLVSLMRKFDLRILTGRRRPTNIYATRTQEYPA